MNKPRELHDYSICAGHDKWPFVMVCIPRDLAEKARRTENGACLIAAYLREHLGWHVATTIGWFPDRSAPDDDGLACVSIPVRRASMRNGR